MKSTCGPRAMLFRFTIKCAKHYTPKWFNCLIVCPLWQSQASIILKACEIYAVMKRKGSSCVGILSDQGEAATASSFGVHAILSFDTYYEQYYK